MTSKTKSWLLALMVMLPLVFVLMFFGYLHPQFDVVIYTDNIKGEGSCSAYLSSPNETFSYLYKAGAYFGSELKTLHMQDLRYDTHKVVLYLYGVKEAEVLSYDIGVFGFVVLHHNCDGDQIVFHPITNKAVASTEQPIAHIINEDPENSLSLNIEKSIGIPVWVWIVYFVILFLIAAIFAFGLAFLFDRIPGLKLPLLGVSVLLVTMIMGCLICGSLPYVDYTYFILNWLVLFAVSLLLNALTLPWVGTACVSVCTLIWYIANYFVIKFRNKPIMPADLKAAGTAREVIGGYDLTPTWTMILAVALVLLYLAVLVFVWAKTRASDRKPLKKALLQRGALALIALCLLYFSVNNPAFTRLNEFQWDAKVLEGFHREGIVLTFVKSAISSRVTRPEGYSREIVDSYLKEYQAKESDSVGVQPTRIIMIMNEAFSDLRVVGLDDRIDVMPFIDSLESNTVKGSLFVSVLGGGTCNTEFEALTGNSMAFLGSGAYPYTENVTYPMFSLAAFFRENGYYTEAFHANQASNWNRNVVYPNFGFDDFFSLDKYKILDNEEDYLHLYVSDRCDYRQIKSEDESHQNQPRFLFGVTIQNHADYDHFYDVEEADSLRQYESELDESAKVYLSLIKASDDAVRQLVETYEDSKEPTMIVFFGDHQPYLGGKAQEQVYAGITNFLDYFRTKFFVWTNYDTKPIGNLGISANYLPWLILERANFSLPPYFQMLKEVYEAYPILTSQGVVSASGTLSDNVAELYDDPLIRKYQYIQYANLFDELDPAWFEVK